MTTQPETDQPVRVGQTWADNDPRATGRTLRVDFVVGDRAICTVLTPADDYPQARTGHQVNIRIARMRPTSTGYRLVQDTPEEAADA